ncbi:MAG TPA: cation diffusion facilitator family transporter [Ferruginibacter sp.]|jgi:cobalt-zinc-cadmium efflux system protein|nr:cation diffusion facilitator family transporter [Ferruginibacter sp.]
MEHSHDHSHHHHHHTVDPVNMNTAFIVGIILNFAFVLIEVIAGFYNHSLSLLSDAGHNLADVGALGLSLLAFKLLKIKSTDQYTYGYRKTSILVALFNSVVLLISIAIIAYEGVHRLFHPQHISGINVSIIAGIGIVINFSSARLFFHNKESDINIKAAYLHLMSDAVVSLGIVIGGILMYYLNWFWLDPLISIIIAIIILISTWHVLRESLRLSMDGVPEDISIADIKAAAMKVNGVKDFHHIHVWAISSTENALTGHLVIATNTTPNEERKIKHDVKHWLEHKKIHHSTLETERENETCEEVPC